MELSVEPAADDGLLLNKSGREQWNSSVAEIYCCSDDLLRVELMVVVVVVVGTGRNAKNCS